MFLEERQDGLHFRAYPWGTAMGHRMELEMMSGQSCGASVNGYVIKSHEESGIQIVTEYDLLEISVSPCPSDPKTWVRFRTPEQIKQDREHQQARLAAERMPAANVSRFMAKNPLRPCRPR